MYSFLLIKDMKKHILQGIKKFTYLDLDLYLILVGIYINEGSYKKARKILEQIDSYNEIGLFYRERVDDWKAILKMKKAEKINKYTNEKSLFILILFLILFPIIYLLFKKLILGVSKIQNI